ncbi:MAG: 2OG-Fe(II) oxygenase [Alphaproteobacteria bacterium]|nr:2OG-Fe(II) oxygenase [Alphaproteobacteria bacterium]
MTVLDLDAFRRTPLARDPYEHLIVPGLVPAAHANDVVRDFPKIAKSGLFPLSALRYDGAFAQLIADLDGAPFEAVVAEKFGVSLAGKPKLFTIRGRCHPKDGGIHTDSTNKIVTVLLYLNPAWEDSGGRLRVLRGPKDLKDFASEVPPLAGTMLAFRRSERSYHGHEPFAGERRAIQVNWITDVATRDREENRHRWSARFKAINPFA